ncbi:glycosyltransferase [Clostridium sp.]|uniref:glycosyltransferase n=1 Tax=Clostridium sp. TaxID=1506 RepID=UPI003D6D8F06
MKLGILRLYIGDTGEVGYYNGQEIGLAKALYSNYGISTDVFLLKTKQKCYEEEIINITDNVRVVYLPASRIGVHGIIDPNLLKKYEINILQLNSDNQLITGKVIRWCFNNQLPVYTLSGVYKSKSKNIIKKIFFEISIRMNRNYQNKIINVTKNLKIYDEMHRKNVRNVSFIPVGLDIKNLKEMYLSVEELKIKYGLPNDKKILLFVGRLEEGKNPFMSLYLIRQLDDWILLIIGQGKLKQKMGIFIKEHNLENKVIFVDKIPNSKIGEIYSISDVLVNFCKDEIFGMTILEAMYYKCLVIAHDAPGPNFIIKNNENGVLVKSNELDEWVKKVKYAIANRSMLSANAFERVVNYLNWDTLSKDYYNIYTSILNIKEEEQ